MGIRLAQDNRSHVGIGKDPAGPKLSRVEIINGGVRRQPDHRSVTRVSSDLRPYNKTFIRAKAQSSFLRVAAAIRAKYPDELRLVLPIGASKPGCFGTLIPSLVWLLH